MTDLQEINIGSAPDDGTGDPLRTAFDKINDNFFYQLFTTTYKGSVPFVRDYVGLHNASGGGAPSYTTAKRGDLALISVAGTVNGTSVSRGDILQANQDSPTTGAHWDVIQDCSAEFKTTIEAAAGNRVKMLPGTYLITGDANPDARVNLTCDKGTVVVMNRLDNTVIDQISNQTYATSTTTQVAVTAVTLEDYTAPLTGNATDYVTVFTCTTVGHAANFLKDTLAAVITDEPNPYSAGSSAKNYLGEPFIVLDSDASTGKVYADGKLAWHNEFAALDTVGSPNDVIKLNTLNGDRRMFMENIEFCAAPTMIGNSGGWWNTLFGTEVTATITGNAGAVRTISSTGHNLVNGNPVQVGTVSGATHTSCIVSNASANSFDITVPTNQDYSLTSPSIPTSGTLYYRPAFDHRNTVHHGNCIVARHASFSRFENLKFDRLWTGGLMVRYSSYCVDNDCEFLRLTSANTDNNNLNGRLGYGRQNYGLSKKNISYRPVGKGGRHLYTDSCPETNSAFSAANWYQHVGGPVDCEVIEGHSDGATGGPWDTHPGSNRTKFKRCTSKDANRGAHEGSYFGHFGQARGSNLSYIDCTQEGGSHGIRIINEINQQGSVHHIDLLARNLTDNGNDSAALRVENMSGVTAANRPKVRGKLRCYNAGWGFYVQDEADVVLSDYVYEGISERSGTVIDDGKVHLERAILDFRDNPLNLSVREAFVLEDAARLTIGTLIIRQGSESDQPTAIFKDNDNVSGKLVDIQHLIYDDPDNVGPIPLVTPGREANFTWLSSRFKHYVAGRYYFPQNFIGTGSAGAVSAGRLYAVPIEILTPTTFTKIGINVTTGATGSPAPARLGIYKDQKGVPGDLVVDAGEVDVTTIAAVEATISKTLFGRYWLAVIFESASSLQITLQSSASTNVGDYGAEGPIGGANVLRPSVTYGPLPSTYPSVTSASFETANIPRIWLRSGV